MENFGKLIKCTTTEGRDALLGLVIDKLIKT